MMVAAKRDLQATADAATRAGAAVIDESIHRSSGVVGLSSMRQLQNRLPWSESKRHS